MSKLTKISLYTFLAFFFLSAFLLLYYIFGSCDSFNQGNNLLVIFSFPVYFLVMLLLPLYFLIELVKQIARVIKGKGVQLKKLGYLLIFAIFAGVLFVLRAATASYFCNDIL